MSALTALTLLQWVALVVLYLALAAVLREVRMLRGQVARLQAGVGVPGASSAGSALGDATRLAVSPGRPAIVLVATSTCPLCRLVLERLDAGPVDPRSAGLDAVLLTYEDEAAWGELPTRLRVVRDADAWSALAHLEPPLLARLDSGGQVVDLVLPASENDVDTALRAWAAAPAR